MALTKAQVREILSEAGIEKENMKDAVEKIIDGHLASIDVLRGEADNNKTAADNVQKELDNLKAAGDGGWKDKHDTLKKEFEDFKRDVQTKETKAAKESAARAYYQQKGITGKALEIAVRGSGAEIEALELGEDGKIKDTKALDALVSGDFSDLVSKTTTQGANTAHPPANNGGKGMTKAEIYKKDDKGRYLMSASERQKALMENQIM